MPVASEIIILCLIGIRIDKTSVSILCRDSIYV